MADEDAIGVVRAHRWASVEAQRERLRADGCGPIIDLAKTPREHLLTWIRERSTVKLLYAFLLARPGDGVHMLDDYKRFAERLAKGVQGRSAAVKDLDSGLVAHNASSRRTMLLIVKRQIGRHRQSAKSMENGKRGGQEKVFSEAELLKAEAIWRNVKDYPTWQDAESAMPEGFTRWRAHALWRARR